MLPWNNSRLWLLVLSLCVILPFHGQEPVFSRTYEAGRKNVALGILNNHPSYFYLLRFNPDIHDIIVERRSKPSGRILNITPLRLDSVNAAWFNYQKLDHLYFEHQGRVYFVFERSLNHNKTIYMKVVDTLGRSGPFIEILSVDRDKAAERFSLETIRCGDDRLLLVASQIYPNNSKKRQFTYFSLGDARKIWTKEAELETPVTGYSFGYTCNRQGRLFFYKASSRIVGFKRRYSNQVNYAEPVYYYRSLRLATISDTVYREVTLLPHAFTSLKSASLLCDDSVVEAIVHFSAIDESGTEMASLSHEVLPIDLGRIIYSKAFPLDTLLAEQLKFYDGSDFDAAGDKQYQQVNVLNLEGTSYLLAERKEENYCKELLVFALDWKKGICGQMLLPRKILYYDDRTRFRNLGKTTEIACGGRLRSFVLEHPANERLKPGDFNYRSFKRQDYLRAANLVSYEVQASGPMIKKVHFQNADYDFAPLLYQSNQCELLMYLSKGRFERFAILPLSP